MDGNQEVTATFDPLVTLEVEVQGPGKVSGDGINCPDICTVHLPVINGRAPEVSLVAIKDDGAALQSWAGGGCPENDTPTCKVTLNESQVVTATFTDSFKLSVNKINAGSSSGLNSGHGQGTVIAGEYSGDFQNLTSPAINCGGTCESPFHSNAKIAIQAFPGYGSASPYPPSTINWGGACAGTPSNVGTCFITMGAASAEVTVTFGLP
ncbi:MAG: hypothetical protein JOZ52_10070 [Acidobacteria bacterium]|nr:hypothetical protein [Acidobacteriota bacterium]